MAEITFDNTSTNLHLTPIYDFATVGRRAVRLSSKAGDDYYVAFGSSTVVTASSNGMLVLGGAIEVFRQPRPQDTYMAFWSSTDVTASVSIGESR